MKICNSGTNLYLQNWQLKHKHHTCTSCIHWIYMCIRVFSNFNIQHIYLHTCIVYHNLLVTGSFLSNLKMPQTEIVISILLPHFVFSTLIFKASHQNVINFHINFAYNKYTGARYILDNFTKCSLWS